MTGHRLEDAPEPDQAVPSGAAEPVASPEVQPAAAGPEQPAHPELGTRPQVINFPHPVRQLHKFLDHTAHEAVGRVKAQSPKSILKTAVPILSWLPKYNWRQWLYPDVSAALVITLMAVPQAMSYANLAGLPSVFGLYGMVAPVLVYGCFGSSKQLGVGPVAVTSLLLGNGLASIYGSNANPNKPSNPALQNQINMAAIQVGLIAGILYTVVGALGLDWIANFLSHTVISGFMTGAAVIIGLSQVKYILGIKIARADTVQDSIRLINGAISTFKWQEFVMGMCWLITIVGLRQIGTKYPKMAPLKSAGPILVTVLGLILMTSTTWAAEKKIAEVGYIPPGVPDATVSWWHITDHGAEKFTLACLICAIDLCESLAIAKALAQKNRDEINVRQEICALGIANLVGAAFHCYTTTGSFSRSAVAQAMGAKSQLKAILTGIFMIIILSTLTPLLSHLPANLQGAVVIAGVLPLLDIREGIYLFGVDLRDWVVWNVACWGTMFAGVETGLAMSVGLSIALIVWEVSFPNIVEMGTIEGSRVWRSTKFYPEAQKYPGILVIRIDASIIFVNFQQLRSAIRGRIIANKDEIEAALAAGLVPPARIHTVVLDLSAAPYMDASAVHLFRDLVDELQVGGRRSGAVQLLFSNPSRQVLEIMFRGKFLGDRETNNRFFLAVHEAVAWARRNVPPLDVEVEGHHLSVGFRALGVSSEAISPDVHDPSVQAIRMSVVNPHIEETKVAAKEAELVRVESYRKQSVATPESEPLATGGEPSATGDEPFATRSEPFATGSEPFAARSNSFATRSDSFATRSEPSAPYASAEPSAPSAAAEPPVSPHSGDELL